jgi:hypothetical protein
MRFVKLFGATVAGALFVLATWAQPTNGYVGSGPCSNLWVGYYWNPPEPLEGGHGFMECDEEGWECEGIGDHDDSHTLWVLGNASHHDECPGG